MVRVFPILLPMKLSLRGVVAAAFVLAMCALCVRLGFWQLDRLEQRRERNEAIRAAQALPPLQLNAAGFDSIRREPRRFANRRARVIGLFVPTYHVLLRGRTMGGKPGVHVVTPLGTPDGNVLVNRGWIPAPDGATPQSIPRPDTMTVTIEGILQRIPITDNGGAPSEGPGGITSFQRLDLATMRERYGAALPALYLQLAPDPRAPAGQALPAPVPPPELGEGNHLSYAVQWFAFALIGLVGLAVLVVRSNRKRA